MQKRGKRCPVLSNTNEDAAAAASQEPLDSAHSPKRPRTAPFKLASMSGTAKSKNPERQATVVSNDDNEGEKDSDIGHKEEAE